MHFFPLQIPLHAQNLVPIEEELRKIVERLLFSLVKKLIVILLEITEGL